MMDGSPGDCILLNTVWKGGNHFFLLGKIQHVRRRQMRNRGIVLSQIFSPPFVVASGVMITRRHAKAKGCEREVCDA